MRHLEYNGELEDVDLDLQEFQFSGMYRELNSRYIEDSFLGEITGNVYVLYIYLFITYYFIYNLGTSFILKCQ
jgi:hypothetical protein